MRQQIEHQAEVNRLMIAAGAVTDDQPVLTREELFLHGLAVEAGVTPREFVYQILTKRGKVAA
jgi:hypothetical protein